MAKPDPNSFEERAKDATNWEYHYEAAAEPDDPWSPRKNMGPRALAEMEKRQRAKAERMAREGGSDINETNRLKKETANINKNIDRFKKAKVGGKRQRSSRASQAIGAQKQMASRRAGKGTGQATQLFDAPLRLRT